WVSDADRDRRIDPDEIATLLFYPRTESWPRAERWVENGSFTKAFTESYRKITSWAGLPPLPGGLASAELQRRALVVEDLDQGKATLVRGDFRSAATEEKQFVTHMVAAAALIDRLFARQHGLESVVAQVPADDPASQSMFRRNWGARCAGPKTERIPACSAIPGAPAIPNDVYPASIQQGIGYCRDLEQRPDAAQLLAPFGVVREKDGKLEAVPYNIAYADLMEKVAAELDAAAKVLSDPKEQPLRAYLAAAAQGFRSNDWLAADEAWARMSADNSKWYLRIAPDEVYWEPCNHKAGFHMSFGRINPESKEWQDRLVPVQQEMENALAAITGPPYKPHKVTFHLPDFVDIVLNAGDSRDPIGGTTGQSLPNWGPVAREGRGRTVAMSNLYTDQDSLDDWMDRGQSLLTSEALEVFKPAPIRMLVPTILHEAAHNLGPTHEYRIGGKTDAQLFGGALCSTVEELKAQTGALWLIGFLKKRGLMDAEKANHAYVASIIWALDHVARGMYNDLGQPKNYSQLAAIQLGFFIEEGVLVFDAEKLAANGQDKGVFDLQIEKLGPAIEKLMKLVGEIKAKGDRTAAETLVEKYVRGTIVPHRLIAERILRYPKANFVYAIDL
ncbi:MAG: hypothetical protein V2A73_04750, partial [Pseudomonadota bacterium]